MIRRNFIQTYMTIGATFGFILIWPAWAVILTGRQWPQTWSEAKPPLIALMLALGHGVLRAYTWLPSLAYHIGAHKMTFDRWLYNGW
jgi:biotin transporter BioY